ncbi:MAG: MarR family transcriptional regulator [Spirochaetales bacterium]|nr:MarR family transcriptional regulator [Spirochaetales bacterium]
MSIEMNAYTGMPHYLLRFGHHLIRGFKHKAGEKYSLNKSQMRTLIILGRRGGQTMTELVTHMNIEKGSMTSVVDSLIEGGFVSRERDSKDRRKVLISLLPPGQEMAQALSGEMEEHIRSQLNLLGEERVASLMELVEVVKESLEIWENTNE